MQVGGVPVQFPLVSQTLFLLPDSWNPEKHLCVAIEPTLVKLEKVILPFSSGSSLMQMMAVDQIVQSLKYHHVRKGDVCTLPMIKPCLGAYFCQC